SAAAGVSSATASAIISGAVVGTVTFSSTTASTWAEQRDKSWAGIERALENGEIDQATYDNIKQIKNMSDEDWQKIEIAHKNGELSDEDYNSIKSIREMPTEWQTTENLFTGFKKGTIEGAKAAAITIATMGIGGKLSSVVNSKLPTLLAKMPKGSNIVVNKLLGNIVEETSESAVEYGSQLAIDRSFSKAYENNGGFWGLALGMGAGVLLDLDLPKNIVKSGKNIDLPNSLTKSVADVDLPNAQYLADGSEAGLFDFGDKNQANNYNNYDYRQLNNALSNDQIRIVNDINTLIANGQSVKISYKNTADISTEMLSKITDLSKVNFEIVDGLGDAVGNLKNKYKQDKYYDRISYNGNEMNAIIKSIESMQARIDLNLPVVARARQVYEVLSEIPAMREYRQLNSEQIKVPQSLRGVTDYNVVGKAGLICAGYSSVFKELCDRVGIKADYIRGKATFDPLRQAPGPHAWNVVITDNGVIPVDVTWKASGNGEDWFGPSEKFARSHVADEFEEAYHDFNQPIQFVDEIPIQSLPSGNTINNINDILKFHEQKYPGTGIASLRNIVETKNYNVITSNGGARTLIQNIPIADVQKYLDLHDSIQNAIRAHDAKYGYGKGWDAIKAVVDENGNYNRITSANGARASLQQFSLSDIKQYIYGG
ncbi:MAG TPA: hypothetical protein PK737_01415, partial [Bacilli bacterium]|nr:hypothetical protein [Bacilli bacterium]